MNKTFQKLKNSKLNYFKEFKGMKGKTMLILLILFLSTAPVWAGSGAAAFTTASNEVKKYWTPIKIFIQIVGGVVGLIGALRIYNKWQNGDQDVNKEILGWGGACLFLTIAPIFVSSFFGLN